LSVVVDSLFACGSGFSPRPFRKRRCWNIVRMPVLYGTPRTPSRPVTPAGTAQPKAARAKRSSAVAPAGTQITRM
jgi:hypothetical protein